MAPSSWKKVMITVIYKETLGKTIKLQTHLWSSTTLQTLVHHEKQPALRQARSTPVPRLGRVQKNPNNGPLYDVHRWQRSTSRGYSVQYNMKQSGDLLEIIRSVNNTFAS